MRFKNLFEPDRCHVDLPGIWGAMQAAVAGEAGCFVLYGSGDGAGHVYACAVAAGAGAMRHVGPSGYDGDWDDRLFHLVGGIDLAEGQQYYNEKLVRLPRMAVYYCRPKLGETGPGVRDNLGCRRGQLLWVFADAD